MHRGHLFVGDRLLSESSLAHHPLTPMHDPDLVRVLGRQTARCRRPRRDRGCADRRRRCRRAHRAAACGGRAPHPRRRRRGLRPRRRGRRRGPPAPAWCWVAPRVSPRRSHARRHRRRERPRRPLRPTAGRSILSGSGSARTRAQVAAFGAPHSCTLEVEDLAADFDGAIAAAVDRIARSELPLVSATAEPDAVARTQARWGVERSAALIEQALACVAILAVESAGGAPHPRRRRRDVGCRRRRTAPRSPGRPARGGPGGAMDDRTRMRRAACSTCASSRGTSAASRSSAMHGRSRHEHGSRRPGGGVPDAGRGRPLAGQLRECQHPRR